MAGLERKRSTVDRSDPSVPVGLVIRPTRLPLTRSRCFSRRTSIPSLTLTAACGDGAGAAARCGFEQPPRIRPAATARHAAGPIAGALLRLFGVASGLGDSLMAVGPFFG